MRLPSLIPATLLALACIHGQTAETRPPAFPEPAPATAATSDAEAAAAVAQVLSHPLTRRLLDLDGQLAEAIPAFEKTANVLVIIERKPLIHVMLTAWWQYVATRGDAPRPVLLFTPVEGGETGYTMLDIPLISTGDAADMFGNATPHASNTNDYVRAMLAAGAGLEGRTFRSEGLNDPPIEERKTVAIVLAGRLVHLSPAQAKELARPVVVGLRVASPVQRTVDFTVDRMPLPDAAASLVKLAGADLVIPSLPPRAGGGEAMPLITVSVHAKTIEEILIQVGYVTRWVCDTSQLMTLPAIGVDHLYDQAPRSLVQTLAQPDQGPSANGAQTLIDELRVRLPALPLRPLITFRPEQAKE
jgi:hypothetical protein